MLLAREGEVSAKLSGGEGKAPLGYNHAMRALVVRPPLGNDDPVDVKGDSPRRPTHAILALHPSRYKFHSVDGRRSLHAPELFTGTRRAIQGLR